MFIPAEGPFDLVSSLYSGQAFRWRRQGEWSVGVVFGNIVKVRQVSEGIEFTCGPGDEKTMAPLLRDYLGMNTNLDLIYRAISVDDRIRGAISTYRGMRILRQDPWECLIGFIISSYSNIARISRHVEDLAMSFGRPLSYKGEARSTFPAPGELSEAGEGRLRAMGLGYRAPYVARTAGIVAEGGIDLYALREVPYQEALDSLLALPGVGDKVANCVLLCSLDKPDAFPVDVWVQRALREWYLDGSGKKLPPRAMRLWAMEHFGPYAGYANHYLFHTRRLESRRA